jgi:hypothetical protein
MAELADALDLGSSAVKGVQVQVLFPAPTPKGPNRTAYRVVITLRGAFIPLHGILNVGLRHNGVACQEN